MAINKKKIALGIAKTTVGATRVAACAISAKIRTLTKKELSPEEKKKINNDMNLSLVLMKSGMEDFSDATSL